MGILTFGLNVTLDGCCDHREGIADETMPRALREWARKLEAKPKYVVSASRRDFPWINTFHVEGDLCEAVTRLKEQTPSGVLVGSPKTLPSFYQSSSLCFRRLALRSGSDLHSAAELLGQRGDERTANLVDLLAIDMQRDRRWGEAADRRDGLLEPLRPASTDVRHSCAPSCTSTPPMNSTDAASRVACAG